MGTFRSNLPLGTSDSTVFVEGNVPNLDEAMNSQQLVWANRFGIESLTYNGVINRFDNQLSSQDLQFSSFLNSSNEEFQRFLDSSGYSGWDVPYAAGIVLNSHNQGFTKCEPDGTACMFYTPLGTTPLPYTTTGDWASESALFVARSADDALRQDLALQSKGSRLVSFGLSTVYEKLDRLKDINDFLTVKDAVDDAISSGGVVYVHNEVSVRIPEDAETLSIAINRLIPLTDKAKIKLIISSGHKPSSGIEVRGRNLSAFSISSESGSVYLDSTFPSDKDFISVSYGRAPTLDCLVVANQFCRYGYFCDDSSLGYVSPGCGVIGANEYGLYARDASSIIADETIWTGTGNKDGSSGILAWAATIAAYGADASGGYYYGAQAAAGGTLNFRSGNADNAGRHGVRATNSGTVNAPYATAKNCGVSGFRSFDAGTVNADFSDASGSEVGFYAEHASKMSCREALANNCVTAVFSSHDSVISGHMLTALGSTSNSVSCSYGGNADVSFSTLDCSGVTSLACIEGGEINAARSTISNTSGAAIGAILCQGGEINASFAKFSVTGSGRMVTVRRGGKLVMNAATLTKPSNGDVLWLDGGSFISATGCGIVASEITGPYNTISSRGIVFA